MATSGTVFVLQPELSSQQAVGILVAFKAILGYRPSKNVIEKGGYRNKTEFVNKLSSQIEREFARKHSDQSGPIQKEEGVTNDATTIAV